MSRGYLKKIKERRKRALMLSINISMLIGVFIEIIKSQKYFIKEEATDAEEINM